jgi:hypothetical protein
MSEGRTRITVLEPDGGVMGNYVPHVTSFRSNTADDHFVVSLSVEGNDESPMGYVDKRAAVDLAAHFVEVAQSLGADVYILSGAELERRLASSRHHGIMDGRYELRDELQAHLNAV